MSSAQDDYNIALNILARVGLNGDLIGEFSKAKAGLNMMNSMNQLNAQQSMATNPPVEQVPQQTPAGGTMEPQIQSNAGIASGGGQMM